MPTTSNRRIAATFQCGRDPDQDQIVEWLKTLPTSEKGMVERSVMKYHITRALLLYIQSGKTSLASSSKQGVSDIPVLKDVVVASVDVAKPVAVEKPQVSTPVHVSTTPVSVPPVVESKPVKPAGSLLRSKIAKSMST